jgi:hypothetical protein
MLRRYVVGNMAGGGESKIYGTGKHGLKSNRLARNKKCRA